MDSANWGEANSAPINLSIDAGNGSADGADDASSIDAAATAASWASCASASFAAVAAAASAAVVIVETAVFEGFIDLASFSLAGRNKGVSKIVGIKKEGLKK